MLRGGCTAAAIILSVVFYKELTRLWAQIIATVCAILLGCYATYFGLIVSQYRRVLKICAHAEAEPQQHIVAVVNKMDTNYTTYRFLPFKIVEVTTSDNEQRRVYLFDGELKEQVAYAIDLSQNIVCGYEEQA